MPDYPFRNLIFEGSGVKGIASFSGFIWFIVFALMSTRQIAMTLQD